MISPSRPRARHLTSVLTALAVAVASFVPLTAAAAPVAAAAAPLTTADFDGRGWGHGRGMSQYGAFGYARDHGWTKSQILDHYYGGTTAGQASTAGGVTIDPLRVRIRLMGLDGQIGTLVGTGPESTLRIDEMPDLVIPEQARALRMLRNGDRWNIEAATSCAVSAESWEQIGTSPGKQVTVRRAASGTDELFTCNPDGRRVHYAGTIRAQVTDVGTRSMNITTIEEYLRGVVPNEMPSSWIAEALQVQAVAARSYAMAGDTRHKNNDGSLYADTCDTTTCQVYKGRFTQASATSDKKASTNPRTDAAIAATAGEVRVFTSTGSGVEGRIARTEFSSTSGGWTAGGDFPAVQDLGDSISPLHTWNVESVSLAPLNSLGTGNLTGITVTERNGHGADGGRVREVQLDFDGQTAPVFVNGNTVRSRLGLRSDWFTISEVPPPSGFYDIPPTSIYEDAVVWASEEGITAGCNTEGDKFCPGNDVTRAQAATFLWRHAGEPAGSGAQFDDVDDDGVYYFDAVRWVREQGITNGCTETEFCPNGDATRAQLVTFLWRHAGEPNVQGYHGFSDIPDGAYYEEAVTWAVNEEITTGTSEDEFSPNASVTRGQTVLFLHRYLA